MICKYGISKSSCDRVMECMFFAKGFIKIFEKYFKPECDACNFNSDKDKV